MSNPKHVVRSLLRAIRKHVTSVSGNPQWRDYAVSQCRIAVEADAVPASQRLRVAENLAFLINNVHLHNALLIKYNIGIDPEKRNKSMVEAVAKEWGSSCQR